MDPLWKICQWNPELMKFIPPFNKVYERVKNTDLTLDKIFKEKIENSRKNINLDADEEPRDFAEAFLREQHKINQSGIKDHNYT